MNEKSSNASSSREEFGPIRSILWPIHKNEMKKFLPVSLLMFFLLFVYTMVRDLKDVFVRKYAICGSAELLPQLKLWFVLPGAFLLVIIYSALINKFGFEKTFYISISGFLLFFAIFLWVLFPNRNIIHPGIETVTALQDSWPPFFRWIIPCITNWSFTLFYVFSELWGTMALSSLFWQFAYKVTMKNEVKRFFGLYATVGNSGAIFSGGLLKTLAKLGGDAYVHISITVSITFGILAMGLYWYINNYTLKDPELYNPSQVKEKKKKEKVGVTDGLKMIFKSRYLFMICVIVLCYGIGINFFEVVWKKHMDLYISGGNGVADMMANLSMITGVFTIIISLISQNILREFKWRTAALIPPLILAVFGGIFFGVVLYGRYVSPEIFGMNFVGLAVWFGLLQDALSKSAKYSLFDSTKNMAYLPLDSETRTKGQAAVEIVGGRAGKAGSSLMQIILMNVLAAGSNLMSHVLTIAIVFAISVCTWVVSVFNLSKKYEEKIAEAPQ